MHGGHDRTSGLGLPAHPVTTSRRRWPDVKASTTRRRGPLASTLVLNLKDGSVFGRARWFCILRGTTRTREVQSWLDCYVTVENLLPVHAVVFFKKTLFFTVARSNCFYLKKTGVRNSKRGNGGSEEGE
jgi:hypothetical protein